MSGQAMGDREEHSERLPEMYDKLVPVEQLVHGEYNPRRVRPSETLEESIADSGICRPLIVRPDEDDGRELYHITDGWQRYQAATACGYEQLPVRIFETAVEALEATETASIVNEWSTYDWAKYCRALADQFTEEAETQQEIIEEVSRRTVKSGRTVRRYLQVLSLPEEVHPLLREGPDGSEQAWAALKNYNRSVKQCDGLHLTVAAQLARRQSSLSEQRVIGIAAITVEFEQVDDAEAFIEAAAERPKTPLDTIRREVLFGQQHNRHLEVPRVTVELDKADKQALMDYCHEHRKPLTEIVSERIESLAAEKRDG